LIDAGFNAFSVPVEHVLVNRFSCLHNGVPVL
jgi:hypothetical protein